MDLRRQKKLIGEKKEKLIENSTVAIFGLGALGSVASELLTRSGIKKLILVDRDIVEESNLQRQSLYDSEDVGKPKAFVCENKLKKINSKIKINKYFENLNHENILEILKDSNIILDCTDNLQTRFLINEYSKKNELPFIYGSAIGYEGYFMFISGKNNSVCLRCFQKEASLGTCSTIGVINQITHIIASFQVSECIKYLTKEKVKSELHYINIKTNEFKIIKVLKNKNCPTCKNNFEYLNGKLNSITKLCGSEHYQFETKLNYKDLISNLKGNDLKFGFKTKNILILKDGRILIKAKNKKEAEKLFSRTISN